jgi:hypothetical protein
MARYSNVEGRFRDNHELRYSLRALEKFFPDHGHVYIVTDAQAPDWLRPSDRLTLVDHRDLMPEASLPTFDSGTSSRGFTTFPVCPSATFISTTTCSLGPRCS